MLAIFVGIMFLVIGFLGVIYWFQDFLTVIRGFGSLSLVLGGLLAVVFGVASLTPQRHDGKKEK